MPGKPALPIRMKCCGTSPASGSNATKSGHSATANRSISRPSARASSASGTAGPGPPSTPIPPDQHIQQEGREPATRRLAALHVLQLRPPPYDAQGQEPAEADPGDGGGRGGSRLVDRGNRRLDRGARGRHDLTFKLTHYP